MQIRMLHFPLRHAKPRTLELDGHRHALFERALRECDADKAIDASRIHLRRRLAHVSYEFRIPHFERVERTQGSLFRSFTLRDMVHRDLLSLLILLTL